MNILITAGGTSERIDNVRSITNHSTGKLGLEIGEAFLSRGHQVTYLTTATALRPVANSKLTVFEIETTAQLQRTMAQLLEEQTFSAVIHSMAVSDFSSETSLPEEELIDKVTEQLLAMQTYTRESIAETIRKALDAIGNQKTEAKKISSKTERLLLFLKKNPKIIAMIREKQPQTILIGFKLLVGVSEDQLIQVGMDTLEQNHCDFVLANDLEKIHGQQHHGLLLHADRQIEAADTKKEIAQLIVKNVEEMERMNE
ncbi:phosphopantothenate--cysteine ligase [Enterococcus sp. LJL128]|uniref:phosphopantothenate--cysteine ligase n=1 Tax=Enterococcus sp. LJL51 TaxID=3416656 RepID=UPI003CEF4C88